MAIKNAENQLYTAELGGILLAKTIDANDEIKSIAIESVQARAIEKGMGFSVSCYNISFGIGNIDNFLLTTPTTTYLMTLDLSRVSCIDTANNKVGSVRVELFEDTTTTSVGTETQRYIANYNRNSTNTLDATITYAPTITADGTKIFHTVANSAYASDSGLTMQLKSNTKYLIRLTNTGGIEEEYAMNLILFELPA